MNVGSIRRTQSPIAVGGGALAEADGAAGDGGGADADDTEVAAGVVEPVGVGAGEHPSIVMTAMAKITRRVRREGRRG
jgi:hypothetical protein